jgi:hypothetical protein
MLLPIHTALAHVSADAFSFVMPLPLPFSHEKQHTQLTSQQNPSQVPASLLLQRSCSLLPLLPLPQPPPPLLQETGSY